MENKISFKNVPFKLRANKYKQITYILSYITRKLGVSFSRLNSFRFTLSRQLRRNATF